MQFFPYLSRLPSSPLSRTFPAPTTPGFLVCGKRRLLTVKTILREQGHHTTKKTRSLSAPSIPHLQRWSLGCVASILLSIKLSKRFKLPWIVSLAMQASHKQNINHSFQILGPIIFVLVVHQIGGILCKPLTTKQGGSSLSTLVMTTFLKTLFIHTYAFPNVVLCPLFRH